MYTSYCSLYHAFPKKTTLVCLRAAWGATLYLYKLYLSYIFLIGMYDGQAEPEGCENEKIAPELNLYQVQIFLRGSASLNIVKGCCWRSVITSPRETPAGDASRLDDLNKHAFIAA